MRSLLPIVFILISAGLNAAVSDVVEFSDPSYFERYHTLITQLRCPKCQNQNLADSDAPISRDLRLQVQRLLEEGLSNEEIRQYLADRYSAFILYQPEVNSTTYMLWSSPLLVLFAGLFVVMRLTKGASVRGRLDTPVVDQKRLKSLLDNGDSHG